MKKKIKKIWDAVVMTYGVVSIVVAIIYICYVGMGSDVHANAVRALVWLGFGLLIISNYIPKKHIETEQRLVFNQWVEYDSFEALMDGRGGTMYNYSGCVIQTDNSLTISYQDKFGIKTSTYMRTFNPDRTDYIGLDDIWITPLLTSRCFRMNDKFIRLNYNQPLLTNKN